MFGRSAKKLSELVTSKNSKAVVVVNAEKPGKGNFVVSVKGKEVLGLRALPRPFKALRECDLESVANDVIKQLA